MICWFEKLSLVNKNRLDNTQRACLKVVGISLNNLGHRYQVRVILVAL